jgi:hypothetical protein
MSTRAAVVITVASPSVARANLVVNGGFETGDFTGWTDSAVVNYNLGLSACGSDLMCQWFGWQFYTGTRWLISPDNPHSGAYFAVSQSASLQQTLQTTPGTSYGR